MSPFDFELLVLFACNTHVLSNEILDEGDAVTTFAIFRDVKEHKVVPFPSMYKVFDGVFEVLDMCIVSFVGNAVLELFDVFIQRGEAIFSKLLNISLMDNVSASILPKCSLICDKTSSFSIMICMDTALSPSLLDRRS